MKGKGGGKGKAGLSALRCLEITLSFQMCTGATSKCQHAPVAGGDNNCGLRRVIYKKQGLPTHKIIKTQWEKKQSFQPNQVLFDFDWFIFRSQSNIIQLDFLRPVLLWLHRCRPAQTHKLQRPDLYQTQFSQILPDSPSFSTEVFAWQVLGLGIPQSGFW
jgi:hypothetical protein